MSVELPPAGEPDLSALRETRQRMETTLAGFDAQLSYYEKTRRLAEGQRAGVEAAVKAAIARYSAISRPMPAPSDLDELYRTSVMVAAFAHYRADNVARVPFRALDADDRPPPEGHPLPGVHVKALREAYDAFTASREIGALVAAVRAIQASSGRPEATGDPARQAVNAQDLHLICFEYICS